MRHIWKAIAQASGAKMVTVLVTSFLLLAAISYAIYCWQRTSSNENAERALQPPPRARGLFTDESADSAAATAAVRLRAAEEGAQARLELRSRLLERAAQGDKAVLLEALESGDDDSLYDEVLDALLERAADPKKLFALVSYITRSERLRVNARLAFRFLEDWKASADRRSTAVMLHVAAIANDAGVYQSAVEAAFRVWRDGGLAEISAEELRALFDGEYWVLSANVRGSGAGFILKRRLAALRRELSSGPSKVT